MKTLSTTQFMPSSLAQLNSALSVADARSTRSDSAASVSASTLSVDGTERTHPAKPVASAAAPKLAYVQSAQASTDSVAGVELGQTWLRDQLQHDGGKRMAAALETIWGVSHNEAQAFVAKIEAALAGQDPRAMVTLFPRVASVQGALAQGILGSYDVAKREISLDAGLSTHDQAHIYLEELAHHWERAQGWTDPKGDEGELFRRMMMGPPLSAEDLRRIERDQDQVFVQLNGMDSRLEYATGWPSFPEDDAELSGWVDRCIEGKLFEARSPDGKTLMQALRSRGCTEALAKLERAYLQDLTQRVEHEVDFEAGQIAELSTVTPESSAGVAWSAALESACLEGLRYGDIMPSGESLLDLWMTSLSSEGLADARDAYSQTFLANMTEEQTVGYEGFAKWGDFDATCEDYDETLFDKVMYFDNAMPHQRLCDALKTQVESAIDQGRLPLQMKTYWEEALYDVTADQSIESGKIAGWLGAESPLIESDKIQLSKSLIEGAIDAVKQGSASYVDVAMTLAPLAIRTENDSTLLDVIKAHGSRPLYEHARRMLSKRVHASFLAGDYRLAQVATEHADYRWKTPEGKTLLASLCGRVQSDNYQALQRGLMAQFIDARDEERPELTREFLRYGNYRGEKPAALVEAYGTESMKAAVAAELPALCREYVGLYLQERLGGELTTELETQIAERAEAPLTEMLRGDRFESDALSALDVIVEEEMSATLSAEFAERFAYVVTEKETQWFKSLFEFGASMADIRGAFASAETELQSTVTALVNGRAHPKYAKRVLALLLKDPQVQVYIGERVKHAVLAAKVQPEIHEDDDTIAFSEVISELASAEDLEGALRELASGQAEHFEILTKDMTKESWNLLHGKMRQYYDLMMPSVEENALALSAMKRGEVAALKQERAQNIAKGLLLREELKKTLAPMLKVRRATGEESAFKVSVADNALLIETRAGLNGNPTSGAYVLPALSAIDVRAEQDALWVEHPSKPTKSDEYAVIQGGSMGVRAGAMEVESTRDVMGKPVLSFSRAPASVTRIGGVTQHKGRTKEGVEMAADNSAEVFSGLDSKKALKGIARGYQAGEIINKASHYDNAEDAATSVAVDSLSTFAPGFSSTFSQGTEEAQKDVINGSRKLLGVTEAAKNFQKNLSAVNKLKSDSSRSEEEWNNATQKLKKSHAELSQACDSATKKDRRSGEESRFGRELRGVSKLTCGMMRNAKADMNDALKNPSAPLSEQAWRESIEDENHAAQDNYYERLVENDLLGRDRGEGLEDADSYTDNEAVDYIHNKQDRDLDDVVSEKSDKAQSEMQAEEARARSRNRGGGGGGGSGSGDDEGGRDDSFSGGYGDGGGYYPGYVA